MLRDVAARLRVPFSGDYLGQPLSKSVAPKARNAFLGVTHDFSRFARLRESTASVDAGVLEELASDISAPSEYAHWRVRTQSSLMLTSREY